MTKIIITGSKGRMGRALLSCAAHHPDLRIVGQIDQGDDLRSVIGQGDVVIDFSSHSATPAIAALCAAHKKAMVVGTTGHSDEGKSQIANCQSQIPIVLSSNFSTGVNTLFWLTRKAAEILGPGFDLEIVEMHHRLKRDAPSGTARTLAEILAAVRKQQLDKVARHGRVGHRGRAHRGGDRRAFGARGRCGGRPHGDLCRGRRAGRTHPQGFNPRDVCQWRFAGGAVGGASSSPGFTTCRMCWD